MIYVYESCEATYTNSTKKTQIIQSLRLDFTDLPGVIFKDFGGKCWSYIGEFEDGYSAPENVFPISFSGNYFDDSVEIVYESCDECAVTNITPCVFTYFIGERCDNSETTYVKVCDVTPTNSNIKIMPTIGQVVGVRNNTGDDFCVTLKEKIDFVEGALQISTPAWKNYTCDTCPIYKVYTADSCDGTEIDIKLYQNPLSNTIQRYSSVQIDINYDCYVIKSYDGIDCLYNFNEGVTPEIRTVFSSCNACKINNLNTNP